MERGVAFIQRVREDARFRLKVDACANGLERLAFLKREGYDFAPFVQILNNLSSCQQSACRLGSPTKIAASNRALPVFGAASPKYSVPRKLPFKLAASFTGASATGPQVAHLFER